MLARDLPFNPSGLIADRTMFSNWIRRYTPRSLFARAVLILLLPVVVIQLVVGFVFIQRHYEGVTVQMVRAVGRDLNYAVSSVESAPSIPEGRAILDFISSPLGLQLTLDASRNVAPKNALRFFDLSGTALANTLDEMMINNIGVDMINDPKSVLVAIETNKGLLSGKIPRSQVAASNPHQLLVLMLFTSVVLTSISILFLRNQIRPILNLAFASEEFGKGRSVPFRPRGAEEVRRAGSSFLAMRGRLERQIEQRTQMLSGVSHDLRTPLTRLKLSLAMLDDEPERNALLADVREMEQMLDEFLAFAKNENQEETTTFDPLTMAQDLSELAQRTGGKIAVSVENQTPSEIFVSMRASAISRAVQNLLNNAQHFGNQVKLTAKLTSSSLEYCVEDNGPGIAEDKREMALRPFTQLDPSRNKNDGSGVGLGLAIALDVARSHGGTLLLDTSAEMGGLKATLRLPR